MSTSVLASITASQIGTVPGVPVVAPNHPNQTIALLLFNYSSTGVTVEDPESNVRVLSPQTVDRFFLGDVGESVLLKQLFALQNQAVPIPADIIVPVVYTGIDMDRLDNNWPKYIGSGFSLATVSSVRDDGRPAGALSVESTEQGAASSSYTQTNDGFVSAKNRVTSKLQFRWNGTLSGVNAQMFDMLPTDAGRPEYGLNYNTDNSLNIFNYLDGINIFQLTRAGGIVIPAGLQVGGSALIVGALTELGGQMTAGSFGAVPVVAQILNQHITDNILHTIGLLTPAANGTYRASFTATIATPAPSGLVGTIQFNDPNNSNSVGREFFGSTGAAVPVRFSSITAPTSFAGTPLVFFAGPALAISVNFQEAGASPNDWFTIVLERLA